MKRWMTSDDLHLVKRFIPMLRPWSRYAVLAGGLMLVNVVLQLPLPLLTRYVIDKVLPQKRLDILTLVVSGLAAFLIIRLAAGFFSGLFLAVFREKVLLRINLRMFEHIEHLSLSFHDSTKVGYLMSRISNDATNLHGLMADTFLNLIRNSVTLCAGAVILFALHWRLAAMAVALLPLFVYSVLFFSRRIGEASDKVQENIARVYEVLGESLSGIRVIKAFCAEKRQALTLFGRLRDGVRSNIKYTLIRATSTHTTVAIGAISPLVVLWYGGREVMEGHLTLGSLVAFNAFLAYLYGPVQGLMNVNSDVQSSLASLRRIFEILDTPREDHQPARPVTLPEVRGEVLFKDVCFSYDGKSPVLTGVSFKADRGQKVALVGRSGAGKTTLASLIPRLYNPQRGVIYIDGIDIRSVRLADLRKHIGIVAQEPFIFSGTLRSNISYGKPRATDAEVIRAAKLGNAHAFISRLPSQYDTEVGERGVNLSGGERQRVAISRALLKDPKILILDEATSEVDSESEVLIRDALDRLMAGRTTFVIAHRLSTILNADTILVIDQGRLVGIGTHEELLQSVPLYKMLYQDQFTGQEIRTS